MQPDRGSPKLRSSMRSALVLATLGACLVVAACRSVAASGEPPPPSASPADPARLTPVPTSSPSRVESNTFFSQALGRTMPYFAYLPQGYDSAPSTRYPVLYMLHGSGGSNAEWRTYGLFTAADHLIGQGTITPLVIVLPQGDQSFWMDHADGGPQWGTYTARDVVTEIDQHHHTMPGRDGRAIGGLSMGADGALQLAMNYPEVFSVVGAHSPALRTYVQWPSFFGDLAYANAHDPAYLVRTRPDVARRLSLDIDIGTQDTLWRPSAEAFHQQLLTEGIPHEWQGEWPGGHSGEYWSAHTEEYLRSNDRNLKAHFQ
jgi:S-formylglutathione hydrolase FrmB